MLSDGGSSGPIMVPQAIPAFLAQVNAGRLSQMASTLAPIVTGSQPYCIGYQPKCLPQHRIGTGALFSVLCHDIAPFHDPQISTWAVRQAPGTSPAYGASPLVDVCGKWPVAGAAAAEVDQPPTGDVPTLVATGAFGPYAPEAVLRDKLSGLTDVTFAVDPSHGHNVMASTDCLVAARRTWVNELALGPSALACMDDETAPFITDLSTVLDTTTRPAPGTSTRPAAPTEAAALEGTWMVSLSRAEITAALTEGGFAALSERFFRDQEIQAHGTRFVLRISDGRFSGLHNDGPGSTGVWHVGWSGTVTVRGDQIDFLDPKAKRPKPYGSRSPTTSSQ